MKTERTDTLFKASIAGLVLYAVGLAAATVVEKYYGSTAAKTGCYYSPLFFVLQLALVAGFFAVAKEYGLFRNRKWAALVVHFAFIVILAGALTTHLFGKEGSIHLRENESADSMLVRKQDGESFHPLPFRVELREFILTRYPGSDSPSSFESRLLVHTRDGVSEKKVSMNATLDIEGYRLYQASYDKDEQGTVLSVNKDAPGRAVTYAGYALLLLGFLLSLTDKNSRFRFLLAQLKRLRGSARIVGCLLGLATLLLSANAQQPGATDWLETIGKDRIDPEHAARFGALLVQSADGRMKPVNTFSSEALRKIHRSERIGALNSDQFLLSLIAFPEKWMHVPLFAVTENSIRREFGLPDKDCACLDFFDASGAYVFQQRIEQVYQKPASTRNKQDKEILKVDERIHLFLQLIARKRLNLFPNENDPAHKWYAAGDDLSVFTPEDSTFVARIFPRYVRSIREAVKKQDWEAADEVVRMIDAYQQSKNNALPVHPRKIKAERMYNKLDLFGVCNRLYWVLGGLLLVLSLIRFLKNGQWIAWAFRLLTAMVVVGLLCHLAGMSLRGYAAGHAPWSNSYETMVYVAFVSTLGGLLFARQSAFTFALGVLLGGILLFVSELNRMDPHIGALVPVLKSPWLMIHVAVVVAAYGFFGICLLLGLTNVGLFLLNNIKPSFALARSIRKFTLINELSMLAGLAWMAVGIFCGAVWANESWGRYWGWDPKETWALVTLVAYAIVSHLRLIKGWNRPLLFNVLSVLAFLSVLMTYFGVNYFFSGLHSYG